MSDSDKDIPKKMSLDRSDLTPEKIQEVNEILKKLAQPQPAGLLPGHDLHIKIGG